MCDIFKYTKRASYACASSHVSNNKRVGKTCYQKITYVYRVSNMDRVEFKELHITSVYFWAQIFLIFILIEENVHNFIFESKKIIWLKFSNFSERCSSESTSSILDTLYVVNKEDPIKIFFLERLTRQIIKQQSKTHFIRKIAYCVWIYSFG